MCKPNKALRITVKAFLRTEEKKRSKEAGNAAPVVEATPVVQETSNTPIPSIEQPQASEQEAPSVSAGTAQETHQEQADSVAQGAEIIPGDALPIDFTPQVSSTLQCLGNLSLQVTPRPHHHEAAWLAVITSVLDMADNAPELSRTTSRKRAASRDNQSIRSTRGGARADTREWHCQS